MLKRNFNKGTVEDFLIHLPELQKREEDFTVVVSGMSRKIILKNGSVLKYFGSKNAECRVDGAYMVNVTKKEIDKYIALNGTPKYNVIRDVQNFNFDKIVSAIAKKTPVMGVDIRACYWNVAHKLGYISNDVYKRGIEKCSKTGLLISIGCLAKKPLIKTYKNGEFVRHEFDNLQYQKYVPFYWNIIEKTHSLMNESYELFKDSWYMFLTDCIFVDVEKIKSTQKFLSERGFSNKTHLIEFKSYDGHLLKWHDFKDGSDKQIYAEKRKIQDSFALYQMKRAMLSPP